MADRIIKIITPATSVALATTDEVKQLLGVPLADTTSDAQLTFMIDVVSATIMRVCNRVFAAETLSEEWRELSGGSRIFLSHWPVAKTDIQSVTEGDPPGAPLQTGVDFEVEELSGKLEMFGGWNEPVTVTYKGGYDLPIDAPLPLKNCVAILTREMIIEATRQGMHGIRSLSHRESRVMFFDYIKPVIARGLTNLGSGSPIVDQLLMHYTRLEV